MEQRKVNLMIASAVVLLTILGGALTLCMLRYFPRYAEAVISDSVEIGSGWTEFRPSKPLRVIEEYQFIAIEPSSSYSAWKGFGITTPNGELINPEIKILGNDGFECDLKWYEGTRVQGIFSGTEYAEYSCPSGLPRQEEIQKILIRSDIPIQVRRIVWTGSGHHE
jgi:hypothetical protein